MKNICLIFSLVFLCSATLPYTIEQNSFANKSVDYQSQKTISKAQKEEKKVSVSHHKNSSVSVGESIHWSNIVSLIFGVLTYVSFPDLLLFSLPAIVFGAIGFNKRGRGLGITGFILGLIGLILIVVVIFVLATAFP